MNSKIKIGLVSAILEDLSYEDMIDIVSKYDYKCVEVACWPSGDKERRYAGVSHIDVNRTDSAYVKHLLDYANKKNIEISALAYYPNTLDEDEDKRRFNIEHLKKVIYMSHLMGVNMVTTFIGRNQNLTVEENLVIFSRYWPEIISYAEELKVKVAIENCPMLFDSDQWPGGQNLATSPYIWDKIFEEIDSEYFGLNYDPSHMIWQMMDYIEPIYEFKDKIFHVHFKDIKLYQKKLDRYGSLSYPLNYMKPKLPGLGDVKWKKFVSALNDIGYSGYGCIEIEDRSFEDSFEDILRSIEFSNRYLSQYII